MLKSGVRKADPKRRLLLAAQRHPEGMGVRDPQPGMLLEEAWSSWKSGAIVEWHTSGRAVIAIHFPTG